MSNVFNSTIMLNEKQADLAFRIMALCEEFYPDEKDFKENIPVLELLHQTAVAVEAGMV